MHLQNQKIVRYNFSVMLQANEEKNCLYLNRIFFNSKKNQFLAFKILLIHNLLLNKINKLILVIEKEELEQIFLQFQD
jgi:hypothetical protein